MRQDAGQKMVQTIIYLILLILILLVIFALFYWVYFYINCYYGFWSQDGIIRNSRRSRSNVAITFDDGPSEYTEKILDVLKKKKAKATFFLVGKNMEKYPEIAKRIVRQGHEIGSHSYEHIQLFPRTAKTLVGQIEKNESIIKKITGKKPKYFRPPRGTYDQKLRRILVSRGYKIILWTISSQDWRNPGTEQIVSRATNELRNGDIILFHDGIIYPWGTSRQQRIDALPEVIDEIKRKKLKPVKLSELLNERKK